jgi:hypothetical protein
MQQNKGDWPINVYLLSSECFFSATFWKHDIQMHSLFLYKKLFYYNLHLTFQHTLGQCKATPQMSVTDAEYVM